MDWNLSIGQSYQIYSFYILEQYVLLMLYWI